MRIDAHQHFWQYDPVEYDWIDASMKNIAKDRLPADLEPILQRNNFEGCIAVQARQTEAETDFLIDLAEKNSFIQAVVGWVDFRAENITERLTHYSNYKVVKGFRHVLQGERPEFMLEPDFLRGIACLRDFDFVYDILIFPQHLPATIQFVKQFPEHRFVLDHLAKPPIKTGLSADWEKNIRELARFANLSCKISGMVTEGDWSDTKTENYKPYIRHILDCFGPERVMFGSDWPVCEVAAPYENVVSIVEENTKDLTDREKQLLWSENARQIYRLDE